MSYKSPFRIIDNSYDVWSQVHEHLMNVVESFDNMVIEACIKVGVVVDKYELEKALQYDRDQYRKGYEDGRASVMKDAISIEDIPEDTLFMRKGNTLWRCDIPMKTSDAKTIEFPKWALFGGENERPRPVN